MNVYGKAMTDSKRQAHSKVVELILTSTKTVESADGTDTLSLVVSVAVKIINEVGERPPQ